MRRYDSRARVSIRGVLIPQQTHQPMLQTIGFMIGFYIILRATSLYTRIDEREEQPIVRLLSIITILITILCMCSLFTAGWSSELGLDFP